MFGQIDNKFSPPAAGAKNAPLQGAFTPCAVGSSLLNTQLAAAKNAGINGGTVSLSPSDFGFDQIRHEPHLGESYLRNDNLMRLGIFRGKFQGQERIKNNQQPTTSKKGR